MNENKTLQITLTLTEANQILEALGNLPFRQVYQLISKIQHQAEAQLQSSESILAEPSIEEINQDGVSAIYE